MKIFQPIVTSSLNVSDSVIARSFSGSFSGSGANLFNIPASGITGLNLSQISSGTAVASISETNGFRVSTNTTITGSFAIVNTALTGVGSLSIYNLLESSIVGANGIFNQATGSYTSTFVKYAVSKGANSRAGDFIVNWNGTTVEYTDVSTKDIGDTSGVVFSSILDPTTPSNIAIRATTATSGWKIKALATFI